MNKALIGLLIGLATLKYDIEVSAAKLYQDYKNNRQQADKLYLNKKILIHGVVKERSTNLKNIYLSIPGPGDGITAVIDWQDLESVRYKAGDKADLVCISSGLVFGLPIVVHCKSLN